MAVTFIKRTDIPVAERGKVATKATVTVTDKGQLTFNSLTIKLMNGEVKAGLGVDKETGEVTVYPKGNAAIAKADEKTLFTFGVGKKSGMFLSAGNFLKMAFGDHVYDYANSGNQSFDVTINEKKGTFSFTLPEGALTPKPKAVRKPRKSKPSSVKAEVGSTEALKVEEVEELVLSA